MNGNGIGATLAHAARVHDDNTYIRSVIQGYTFMTYGKVLSYTAGRVDVQCGSLKFTNVEVLVLGINGWGIKPVPAVDDIVLLVGSQAPIIDMAKFESNGSMPPYDVSGLKAIPVTTEETAQLITVDKDGISVTGDTKLTVNSDGIYVEDKNKNKVTTSDSGIEVIDANENTITATSDGISITDANSNTITMDSNGIKLNDKLHIN